jgi:hypothetical protein
MWVLNVDAHNPMAAVGSAIDDADTKERIKEAAERNSTAQVGEPPCSRQAEKLTCNHT